MDIGRMDAHFEASRGLTRLPLVSRHHAFPLTGRLGGYNFLTEVHNLKLISSHGNRRGSVDPIAGRDLTRIFPGCPALLMKLRDPVVRTIDLSPGVGKIMLII